VIAGGPKQLERLLAHALKTLALSWFVRQRFVMFIAKRSQADLTTIGELMTAGKVTPVIDRCYRLNEAAEALRYLEAGHARGKVVIVLE
jgi:NADPH:quinone reductase-like Zn-dependent oxidoreductase